MIHNPYTLETPWAVDPRYNTERQLSGLTKKARELSLSMERATIAFQNCMIQYNTTEGKFLGSIQLLETRVTSELDKIKHFLSLEELLDRLTELNSKPCFDFIKHELEALSKDLETLSNEYQDLRAKKRVPEQKTQPEPAPPLVKAPKQKKQAAKPKDTSDCDEALLATFAQTNVPQASDKDLLHNLIKVSEALGLMLRYENIQNIIGCYTTTFEVSLQIGRQLFIGKKAKQEIYKRIAFFNGIPIQDCIFTSPKHMHKLAPCILSLREGLDLFKLTIKEIGRNGSQRVATFELKAGWQPPMIPPPPPDPPLMDWGYHVREALIAISNIIQLKDFGVFKFTREMSDQSIASTEDSVEFTRNLQEKVEKNIFTLHPFELEQLVFDFVWEKLISDPELLLQVELDRGIIFFCIPEGTVKPSLYQGDDGHCRIPEMPLPRPPSVPK